jgi:hypothetical protein
MLLVIPVMLGVPGMLEDFGGFCVPGADELLQPASNSMPAVSVAAMIVIFIR